MDVGNVVVGRVRVGAHVGLRVQPHRRLREDLAYHTDAERDMDTVVDFINGILWGTADAPLIFKAGILGVLLIAVGIYFTIRLRAIQIRHFLTMFKVIGSSLKPDTEGGVSSFGAFTTSLGARVGAGNISGVAIAITLGGPGAIFWMWVVAFIGMATAMCEATLAQVFKQKSSLAGPGVFRGGPAYYMARGLNARWMGVIFSILLIIAFPFVFNAVQANTLAVAVDGSFTGSMGIPQIWIGLVVAALTILVIFGSISRIAKVTELVVPFMALAYMVVGIAVIIINITEVPDVISDIFVQAFVPQSAAGGFAGYAISQALTQGVKRGLFSNEAGLGSAPNAAAAADVKHPVNQGYIQTLGVFVDTIIVCTTTALIILMSGVWTPSDPDKSSYEGVQLTQDSLSASVGEWGGQLIAITLVFFTFSSIIANYYYGETGLRFFTRSKVALMILRLCVIGMVIWGSVQAVATVWNLADAALGLMALVNLAALLLLGGIAIKVVKDFERQRKEGVDKPVFDGAAFPELEHKLAPGVWTPDPYEDYLESAQGKAPPS